MAWTLLRWAKVALALQRLERTQQHLLAAAHPPHFENGVERGQRH